MRARVVGCVLLLVLSTASGARAADPPYYLALGDSLAVGVQPAPDGSLVPTAQGYVDDLYALYRTRVPTLKLAKLGCSGETTSSMIAGGVGSCYATGSQLLAAIAFIRTHRVELITLDIGANNLLTCLNLAAPIDPNCISAQSMFAGNDLATILSTLHAAAPNALLVGMNYYDPFLAAFVFGPNGPAFATASLAATTFFNGALKTIYQALGVPMADVASAYRITNPPINVILALTWTWMAAPAPRGPDIHPNPLGYAIIAGAFAKTIGSP